MDQVAGPLRRRLLLAGVAAAVVAVAALAVLVLEFGKREPGPHIPSEANAAIPGDLLYVTSRNCVVRAPASGISSRREVTCLPPQEPIVALSWSDTNHAVYARALGNATAWFEVDLSTGVDTVRVALGDPAAALPVTVRSGPVSPRGERVDVAADGTVYLSDASTRRPVFRPDVEEGRFPWFVTWSPDGDWIVLSYDRDGQRELWLLARDGATVRLLDRDVRTPVSWRIAGAGVLPSYDLPPGVPAPAVAAR
ncbi:MAG: hypothetical protein IT304_02985 [Dehalococcoidia bacterium]|nr:hypothetical protein [Dehalococcoidia bacterium]